MGTDPDWPARLADAAASVARSPAAPAWLKEALRDAMTVAAGLAPRAEAEPVLHEFLYPH